MMKLITAFFYLIFISTFFLRCSSTKNNTSSTLNNKAFCFYYNWYGSSEKDGEPYHWAHAVLKQHANDTISKGFIPGGDNISSNYFPQLGAYSSTDRGIIKTHMQMLRKAGIGVIVLTWWNKADFGYKSVPAIMDEAAKNNIKVCFHIEPFAGRNGATTKDNIQLIIDSYGLIIDSYGTHPAFYRMNNKPLFFVYDSYLTAAAEWSSLLLPNGSISIRNTKYDAIMIGLWVEKNEENFFTQSGFDGFYTYFGATGFTYGSTPANWPYLQQWADSNHKIFIPSVSPGYIDSRVRPWNGKNTRERKNGIYYDEMFEQAIQSKAKFIGITSFNEWHEGTQIEPAVPFKSKGFHYQNYNPLAPDYYLKRTTYWLSQWA